jgi:biotin operon repressor
MDKNIDIEKYLCSSRYTSKEEIMEKTGLNERTIREKISKLKLKRVVIYSSSTKGYRLARELKSMSKIEREEEKRLVEHSLNDCKSRCKQLRKQMRKYIAYLKKAEQIEFEENNENHIPSLY